MPIQVRLADECTRAGETKGTFGASALTLRGGGALEQGPASAGGLRAPRMFRGLRPAGFFANRDSAIAFSYSFL